MALDSYLGLIVEVADFSQRPDMTTARVDTFIDLLETWVNTNIRAREMETTNGSLTVSVAGVITHPTGFLDWKKITRTSSGVREPLIPVNSEGRELFDGGAVDRPKRYVQGGSSTQLVSAPDAVYGLEGIYFSAIPGLSASQTTNWLLTAYQDVYLYGTLSMAEAFVKDEPRMEKWKAMFASAVDLFPKKPKGTPGGQVPTMNVDYPVY